MYILRVKGTRNSTLAYHPCESHVELRELLAVYRALGYKPEALVVEETINEQAA